MDEHLIDKRILERQIKRGKLDASEYRRLLERLPDRSEMAQRFELEPEPKLEARPEPRSEQRLVPPPPAAYSSPSQALADLSRTPEASAPADELDDLDDDEPEDVTSPADGF